MPAFEQTKFALSATHPQGSQSVTRALDVATKAAKLTHDLRRPQPAPPPPPSVAPSAPDDAARELLERRISSHLPAGRLVLGLTDNRFTMISVKRDVRRPQGPIYVVRVHHMFVGAPPAIARSLARYIARNERNASRELSRYIEDNQVTVKRQPRRATPAVTLEERGEVFHLGEVFADLNARYFDNKIEARITWSSRGGRPRRRTSIKMGSYSVEEKLIRMHAALDRPFVPRYFLEWIVFHEMLHQIHDMPIIGGRRRFHTPAFAAAEKTFEHYDLARAWERKNLDKLLEF